MLKKHAESGLFVYNSVPAGLRFIVNLTGASKSR